jgi:ligand-binding sensor domain-containing protein
MLNEVKSRKAGGKLYLLFIILFLSTEIYPQWVQTNGPYGGNITCFVASETNLFAGTIGGVFLSTDNGTSWSSASNGLPSNQDGSYQYVRCLALSGTNLFAGTNDGIFLSTDNGTSWSSASNGTSWSSASNGLPTNYDGKYQYVGSLALSGTSIFAGTSDGVFLSTNNGAKWTKVSTGLPNDL